MADQDSDQRNPDPQRTETVPSEPPPIPSYVPEHIGKYHIKRVIASGGMGTVYEATQDNPRRVVAVKVMKQGISSKSALRRFEYEGQILGRLRHPGIAQIYEAGTHGEGHGAVPYFAMEYIPNAKLITTYADEKKLGTRQRMELFAKVCDAIHHGHQKGIIHRDLKPSNILVDSTGQVKIIDFGVARSTDSDMAVTTLQTDVGQLIGTLQYMSPEQCEGDPHDIDTRSDVYALGIVFYQLLCGKLPYDLTRMAIHQATRAIREQHPTKLSTLDKTLRGDVETIALKALEKERERRYQSAADLGHDLQRYLNGEAILARRTSIIYQLRLFARRNKAVFASLAAVFIVLVAGIIVSTSLYFRAESARTEAESNLTRAREAEQRATTDARKAERVVQFLENMLSAGDPHESGDPDMKVRAMIGRAASTLESDLKDEPELQASAHRTIGLAYLHVGLDAVAEHHLRSALRIRQQLFGDQHLLAAQSLRDLAELVHEQGDFVEGQRLCEQALEIRRTQLGDENPEVAETLVTLGDMRKHNGDLPGAESMLRNALRLSKSFFGEEHDLTFSAMNDLALVLELRKNFSEAELLLRTVVATTHRPNGTEHPEAATFTGNLANLLAKQGKLDEAQTYIRRSILINRKVFGEKHPRVANRVRDFADILLRKGDLQALQELTEEVTSIVAALSTEADRSTAKALWQYAEFLLQMGALDRAEDVARRGLAMCRRLYDSDHLDTAASLNQIGNILHRLSRPSESVSVLREALSMRRRLVGDDHPLIGQSLSNLGRALELAGSYDEAEPILRQAVEMRRRLEGESHLNVSYPLLGLGRVLMSTGRSEAAEPVLRECLSIRRNQQASSHPEIAEAESVLGACLTKLGQYAEAENLLQNAYEKAKINLLSSRVVLDEMGNRIVDLYQSWGMSEKAEEFRTNEGTRGTVHEPPDDK